MDGDIIFSKMESNKIQDFFCEKKKRNKCQRQRKRIKLWIYSSTKKYEALFFIYNIWMNEWTHSIDFAVTIFVHLLLVWFFIQIFVNIWKVVLAYSICRIGAYLYLSWYMFLERSNNWFILSVYVSKSKVVVSNYWLIYRFGSSCRPRKR